MRFVEAASSPDDEPSLDERSFPLEASSDEDADVWTWAVALAMMPSSESVTKVSTPEVSSSELGGSRARWTFLEPADVTASGLAFPSSRPCETGP